MKAERKPLASREGIESFLVALGLFLAALVWFWITIRQR
jgi:hypothetical protein